MEGLQMVHVSNGNISEYTWGHIMGIIFYDPHT